MAGFGDKNFVAYACNVVFVVNLEFLGTFDDLLVEGMLYSLLYCDDDGLVHFIGYDDTDAVFTQISFDIYCVFHLSPSYLAFLPDFFAGAAGSTEILSSR